MRISQRKEYCSPAIGSTAEIELEPVLAGLSAAEIYFEPLFVVEGHEVDGYYENGDIINAWD